MDGNKDAPPNFTEATDGAHGAGEGIPTYSAEADRAFDFPDVGELPIPNVNPKTAHVSQFWEDC